MRSRTTQERKNTFPYTLPDPDLEIRGSWSSRPLDKGAPVSKQIFSAPWVSVWSKNKGGLAPRPLPWIRQCYTNSNTVFPRIVAGGGGDYFFFAQNRGNYSREAIISNIAHWKSCRVVIFRA